MLAFISAIVQHVRGETKEMLYWLVGLGGLVGSMLRYGISGLPIFLPVNDISMGVYIGNVVGSFLLAWLLVCVAQMGRWGEPVQHAVGTGLLGSFTTFSALSAEAFTMLDRGDWLYALFYVGFSIIGGWIAAWLGWRLGQNTIPYLIREKVDL